MRIIAFDTGIDTGVATYFEREDGSVEKTLRTLDEKRLNDTLKFWADTEIISSISELEMNKTNFFIIEKIPLSSQWILQRIFNKVESFYRDRNVEIIEIFPSRWKPFAKAQDWQCKMADTQHESDAYNLLRYFALTVLKKDIGEL